MDNYDIKKAGQDFVVGPLEGLWRADDPSVFLTRRKDARDSGRS
ncbi:MULTISPECIES: hypothetical protein [Amycolatopsis]|uniref:Uncharacterized protein n=2 Tax=Amycolatopsis TaxID=1813 RepID=A0A1I3MDR6_9PSEU|nr:hypothetical protein [Amycolatopsis sacchari]SFI95113.1 hypothetical protein SAMN05421835_102287 [Amycolatopsis sacchari]